MEFNSVNMRTTLCWHTWMHENCVAGWWVRGKGRQNHIIKDMDFVAPKINSENI